MRDFEVIGARGRIGDIEAVVSHFQRSGGEGMALDADRVCGRDHLVSAVLHALRAFERGEAISSSVAMETLLYASGERQISRAIARMGIREGCEKVALVLFGIPPGETLEALGLERDDDVLRGSKGKARAFGITEREMEVVGECRAGDLVLERVANLDLIKR